MLRDVFGFTQGLATVLFGLHLKNWSCESRTMILLLVLSALFIVLLLTAAIVTKIYLSRLKIRDVTKKYVFITGCDTGFGNLLARKLDSKGVNVIAGCLTEKGGKDLQEVTSSRLKTVSIDITNKESIQKAFDFVQETVKECGLWGVVNNAGIMPSFAPCEWTSVEEFEGVCKVNLFGTISVSLTFMPLLRQSRGRLVNVCSVTSNCGYPGIANYVISKAAVKMFTTCLRRELLSTGVTTHTIEPGGFKTNVTDSNRLLGLMKSAYKRASPELQNVYGGTIGKYLMGGIKMTGKYVSSKPEHVADAMEHALLAKYPRMRYLVGIDAHTYFRFLSYLPDRVVDYMLGWPAPYGEPCEDFL